MTSLRMRQYLAILFSLLHAHKGSSIIHGLFFDLPLESSRPIVTLRVAVERLDDWPIDGCSRHPFYGICLGATCSATCETTYSILDSTSPPTLFLFSPGCSKQTDILKDLAKDPAPTKNRLSWIPLVSSTGSMKGFWHHHFTVSSIHDARTGKESFRGP